MTKFRRVYDRDGFLLDGMLFGINDHGELVGLVVDTYGEDIGQHEVAITDISDRTEDFLNRINVTFGTSFTESDFQGR